MIAAYKTCTWWSYLTSTFSIFYYGGEHINSQTTLKQVSTLCESTLSCCYLNATFIIRCIQRIFYYYCYFTKNNLYIVLYVSICISISIYCPYLKSTYIKLIVSCSYLEKIDFIELIFQAFFFCLGTWLQTFLHFLMTRKLNKIVYTPKGYIKTTQGMITK